MAVSVAMTDLTSPFAAALTLLWAPTGLIIAAYLGLLQFKVRCHWLPGQPLHPGWWHLRVVATS